jgi:hypothetical protein
MVSRKWGRDMSANVSTVSVHDATPDDVELMRLGDKKPYYCLSIGPIDIFLDGIPELRALSDRIRALIPEKDKPSVATPRERELTP